MKRLNQFKGYSCAMLSAMGYGAAPLLITFVYECGFGVKMVSMLRTAFLIPIFAIAVLLRKESFKITRKQLLKILFLALTGSVLTSLLLFESYTCLDTGTATALNFCYPVFVLALGIIIYKETANKHTWICFAICLSGIVMFCNPGGSFTWRGFLLALGSGVSFGLYVLYMEKSNILEEMGFYPFFFYFTVCSVLILLPIVWSAGELKVETDAFGWLLAAAFAIEDGLMATALQQLSIGWIGSRSASILGALEPATSVVLGILVLNERLTLRGGIGVVLIIFAATYLIVTKEKEAESEASQA